MTIRGILRLSKLIFTPIIILLIILGGLFLFFPYNYFSGNKLPHLLGSAFPFFLVLLIPIDLVLRGFYSKDLKRLWLLEVFTLLILGIVILIFFV